MIKIKRKETAVETLKKLRELLESGETKQIKSNKLFDLLKKKL
jgi:hypothetical protein